MPDAGWIYPFSTMNEGELHMIDLDSFTIGGVLGACALLGGAMITLLLG
jgi:hypothetical protein